MPAVEATQASRQLGHKLNARQRRRRFSFIYLNGGCSHASERVQRGSCIVAAMIGAAGRTIPAGLGRTTRQPEKEMIMLRTFAVALLAASVFTAPVLAQGGGAAATPPVKTETNSTSQTPKVVTATPSLKSAKVKTSKHYAHRQVKHVTHVAQVKPVKHVRTAHAVHGTKAAKPIRQDVSKVTTGQNGATPAPKAKSNVN
jgi:hypothetical protein